MAINACAINGGFDDASSKLIDDFARDAGFELIRPLTSIEAAERQAKFTPICYFMFLAGAAPGETEEKIRLLRHSGERRIQYAPVICFIERPSRAAIISCIMAGFDDILTLPVATGSLGPRLKQQIGRPMSYFETADYFGPDRRRHLVKADEPEAERRRQAGQFRRHEFIRSTTSGVQMLRSEAAHQVFQQTARF